MQDLTNFKNKLNIPKTIEKMQTLPQVECINKHHFAEGQYVRETHMPKGTFAIGKKHRFSTVNIIIKGKLSIYNGENSPILHIEAPYTFVSDAGVQKMAFFHEDTIWLNAHPTEETDLEKIEEEFIIKEEKESLCHG